MQNQEHEAGAGTTGALVQYDFHGDKLDVLPDGERLWVSLRRACEALGVDADSQRKKLAEKEWACTALITVQLPGDAQGREILFLDLDSLPMWLATIEPSRVAEHVRPKLVTYQREAARALRDHFLGRRGPQAVPCDRAHLSADDVRRIVREGMAEALAGVGGPGLGHGGARIHVLNPLLEIARRRGRAIHNDSPGAVRSLRACADRELRRAVGYPADSRQRWQDFPRARLADLLNAVGRMVGETDKLLDLAGAGRQLTLVSKAG